ncbi:MAG: DUF6599 family protein, partial [bacterium]
MNARIWFTGAVLTLLFCCSSQPEEPSLTASETPGSAEPVSVAETKRLETGDFLWPVDSSPDWSVADGPTLYSPDNLYEYNDGAAPKYLSYGFKEMTHIRYACGGDDLSSITLDIYEMETPLGAYGIYSSGRPREISPRECGTESYRVGSVAVAWKHNFYVHALADDERAVLITMLEEMMERVLATVSGDDVIPELLSALPQEDLIPYTDRYIGEDLLGQSFLPGGMLANYKVEDQEALLFYSDLGSPDKADSALGQLRAYEGQYGKILGEGGPIGVGAFRAEDPGLGTGVVARTGPYVA